MSSVKYWKESFRENALCSFISSQSVTAFPSRSLLLRLYLWILQRDIWNPIEGYGEKENIFLKNWKEAFLETVCVLLIHLTELQLSLQETFR